MVLMVEAAGKSAKLTEGVRYPPRPQQNTGHRQGVGQNSKFSTGGFNSYGLCKLKTDT